MGIVSTGMAGARLRLGAVLLFFLATANAVDLSELRRELKAEVEEVLGNDYNDDDKDEDILEALDLTGKYDSAEPPTSSEEIESGEESGSEEVVEAEELPTGVPDIPGLYMEDGVMKYKGEKVASITGMDGKDKGQKVYDDEDEDEDEDVVEEVEPIESISEVKKLTPIKSLSEIKSLLPVKSIKEIANIDEVKEILPIPEDIARKFIAKHKLKHGKKHTISGESELPPDIYEDQPQAGHSEGSSSIEEYVNEMESHLMTVEKEVQRALDLLDKIRNKKEGESPIGEVEVEPQGGWANEEEDEESSEEIASIQPLSSVL